MSMLTEFEQDARDHEEKEGMPVLQQMSKPTLEGFIWQLWLTLNKGNLERAVELLRPIFRPTELEQLKRQLAQREAELAELRAKQAKPNPLRYDPPNETDDGINPMHSIGMGRGDNTPAQKICPTCKGKKPQMRSMSSDDLIDLQCPTCHNSGKVPA